MKTCAVILHYRGDVDKTAKAIVGCGVDEVILIKNSDNYLGVAGGFAKGIKEALKKDCDYIWLLDDDNIPEPNCLKNLKRTYLQFCNMSDMLAAYRDYYDGVGKHINSVIGSTNAYLGLNVFSYFKTRKNLKAKPSHYVFRLIPVAMYGGLFFHRSIIDKIGTPDEKYTLYCGDYEWTYRLTKAGGKIVLDKTAMISEPPPGQLVSKDRVNEASKGLAMFQESVATNKNIFKINRFLYRFLVNEK